MKKLISTVVIATILSTSMLAQSTLSDDYNRSSFSWFYLKNNSGAHGNMVNKFFGKISKTNKFYDNNFPDQGLNIAYRNSMSYGQNQTIILNDIVEKGISREIISMWYNRQSDGTLNQEVIHKRGVFNATDQALISANTTKRGSAALEDFGNRLIDMSYIVVFDISNIRKVTPSEKNDSKGWKANITAYAYKIDFNDEIKSELYNNWIYSDDSEEVKTQKRNNYDNMKFPVKKISHFTYSLSSTQSSKYRLGAQKSYDQLFIELLQEGYNNTIFDLENMLDDLRVKTKIYGRNPLTAKIGRKEGLRTDQRYFVYEYVWNEKLNDSEPVRKGVIRAGSKISNNYSVTSGKTDPSTFYQIAGGKIEEGMLIEQKNDAGINFTFAYESGEIGGAYIKGATLLGSVTGIPSLYLHVAGGLDFQKYDITRNNHNINKTLSFYRFDAGIGKGFHFFRNFELIIEAAYGMEYTSIDQDDLDIMFKDEYTLEDNSLRTWFIKGGSSLLINVTHKVQLVGFVNYYMTNDMNIKDTKTSVKWDEFFKDRSGMSFGGGLRILL
jgi:DUF971 family protein